MSDVFPTPSPRLSRARRELAPDAEAGFHGFSQAVFKEGALSNGVKQLIAVAAAHVTQCPYCIRSHTRAAKKAGVTDAQIMEAIWVAAEMRAGAAVAHAIVAIDELNPEDPGA